VYRVYLLLTGRQERKGHYLVIDLLNFFEESLLMTQKCFCKLGDNQQDS